jgi:biopolymer transport protein ExbB
MAATMFTRALAALQQVVALGGPVVAILLLVSVLTLAVMLYKLWQFARAGVGRHRALSAALAAWDAGDARAAKAALRGATSYLAPVAQLAFEQAAQRADALAQRLASEAEQRFAKLERGFRLLDMVAQLAPLLGLFGTVLGMIDAFQALQEAGAEVDPSVLAGGIWVALMTTAAGLAVSMPTALVLSWFEGRMSAERVMADRLITTVLRPMRPEPTVSAQAAPHAA